jgi:hypothetical protein
MPKTKDAALDKAIAAVEAAHAIRLRMEAEDVPDGPEYDGAMNAELEAVRILCEVRCSKKGQLRKFAYIFQYDKMEACAEPEEALGIGDNFALTVFAVRAFLEQRA